MENIRNFVIIAHIDHGKSTLADRMLEITGTIEARKMRPQFLDRLELERERGITIKMAPVRMLWHSDRGLTRITDTRINADNKPGLIYEENPRVDPRLSARVEQYMLNLIDTPGHSDFSYEVSRALAAVEGAVLLVDGTQGIQAQTLANFRAAKKAGLTIIGAVNKVDLQLPNLDKTRQALADLIGVAKEEILQVSGKTGQGVKELLEAIIEKIPSPQNRADCTQNNAENIPHKPAHSDVFPRPSASSQRESAINAKALIFDSLYDDHKGILAFVRVFNGEMKAGGEITLLASSATCKTKEVGFFTPDFKSSGILRNGEIGYIATGLKEPALVKIGDTIISNQSRISFANIREPNSRTIRDLALPGYKEPTPVVFISFYPDENTKFEDLKEAFSRLRLNDPALAFEVESNEALGRGLKAGFLGQLHFEIVAERLTRDFRLEFMTSFPSVAYRVKEGRREYVVKDANDFPPSPDKVLEPMINLEILAPSAHLNSVLGLKNVYELEVREIKNIGDNLLIEAVMPLRELIRDFDSQLKSASAGFASFSYELGEECEADMVKLEILVAEQKVDALTRIVPSKDMEREARKMAERLKEILPAQQFTQAIQGQVNGRIIARETIAAMRKDVTGYLYGGDRSRKMKLWKKQQRGKKRLKENARVNIKPEVFREILKK